MNLANAVAAVGGGNDELSRMAMNMQQIKTQGKATAMDVRQFAMTGINIYQLLADATGKPIDKVRDLTVTYDLLAKALEKAGQKGGMYYGAMKAQSQSISGKWSTFMDYIQFGEQNLTLSQQDNVKQFEDILISAAKKIPEIVDAIGPFVTNMFTEVKEMLPYVKNVVSEAFDILRPIGEFLTSKDIEKLGQSLLTVSSDLLSSFKPAIELTVEALKPLARLLTRFSNGIDVVLSPNGLFTAYYGAKYGDIPGIKRHSFSNKNKAFSEISAGRIFKDDNEFVNYVVSNAMGDNLRKLPASFFPYNKQIMPAKIPYLPLGYDISKYPHIDYGNNNKGNGNGAGADDGTGGKADKISSGGVRTVTINIGKMVDNFTIHTKTINEGIDNLDNQVAESLLRVLHSSAKMRE